MSVKVRSQLSDPTFVGRGEELATISTCAAEARGGRPWVVSIEGDAGEGKTALLQRALVALPEEFTILKAQCDELAQEVDFAVASQLAPITAHDDFAAGLQLLEKLGDLQGEGPVALVIEDLHWADHRSRQAIVTALRRLEDDQVLALVTTRPERLAVDDAWGRLRFDATRCRRVKLPSLGPEEVGELAERCGVPLVPASVQRLAQHTNGHPLYTRMLLSELTRAQLNDIEGELAAPRSLASTVLAKLAQLPSPAQELAAALAVMNGRIPLGVLGGVADVEDPSSALDALLGTGFVTWDANKKDTPAEFAHPLYRAAVYEDLSVSRRQVLHRAAAEVVEANIALMHRVAAAHTRDDVLADELEVVARGEGKRPTGTTSAEYLLWASSLTSQQELRERRLLEAARNLCTGRRYSAVARLRPRIEACAPCPLRSFVLGMMAWADGTSGAAEQFFSAASSPEAANVDLVNAALAQLHLANIHLTQGLGATAIEEARRAQTLCASDDEVAQGAHQVLGTGLLSIGEGVRGFELFSERFTTPPERLGLADADMAVTRGWLGFYAGHIEGPLADLRASVALAQQGAPLPQLLRAHVHLSQILFLLGDWDEALVNARVADSLIEGDPLVWDAALVHVALASVLSARGHWEDASLHVAASRKVADLCRTLEALGSAALAEASLARARGRPHEVVAAISPLTQDQRQLPATIVVGWWPVMIRSLIESNEVDRAERELDDLHAMAARSSMDLDWRVDVAQAELAVARGHVHAATAAFERAISGGSSYPSLLDRALLHQAYGRHRQTLDDREGALSELSVARQLLEGVGAAPYLGRVDEDLERCGVRAPSRRTSSAVTLTPREQEVAILVSRGLTNREVAARLFVSAKAVEYHLAHVFGKLGIRSRRDLRDHPVLSEEASHN